MKYITLSALLLTGCGGALAPYVPVMVEVAKTVAETVAQRTGKSLDDIPHTCEYEFNDAKRELDVLCTFDLSQTGAD